ncbi:DNA-directed RNA polymerase I subunit RPA34 [Ctenodactylus gundi]
MTTVPVSSSPPGTARFSCPPNFIASPPASETPRFSLEKLTDPDTELWLIQAPADFAPDSLNGRRVPLSGSQIVKGKLAGKKHRYQVLGSTAPQTAEATLLAPSAEASGGLTCAPAPHGSLRIIEGQESQAGILLHPIPASPPPQIPPGLRPRFCAFGGSLPVTGPQSTWALKSHSSRKGKKRQMPGDSGTQEVVNGYGAPEIEAAGTKKKKKKQLLEEAETVKSVETQPAAPAARAGMSEPPTAKKRRKQPKGAETAETDPGLPEPEDRTATLETVGAAESPEAAVLSPTKKRKRQQWVEGTKPGEGTAVESQPQVKEELPEDATPLPPMKKKKKKEKRNVMVEPGTEATEPETALLAPTGDVGDPGFPGEAEPQVEAALALVKKRKKKEKWQNVMLEPETEVAAAELPGDPEPPATPASPRKKKKRHKEHKGSEQETPGQGSGTPEPVPDEALPEMPEPLLNPESGEEVPREGQKKRKRKSQQSPA